MKKHVALLLFCSLFLSLFSCGDDDSKSCTTCNSEQTLSFTICEESNGNASVNGEDTGTQYSVYLDGLVAAGASCGG